MAKPYVRLSLRNLHGVSRAMSSVALLVSKKAAKEGLIEAAKIIQAEAKRRAPVLTGAMRDAIKIVDSKSLKGVNVIISKSDVPGDVDVFYARFIEFGTKHIAPRRFMRGAFESKRNEALRAQLATTFRGLTSAIITSRTK